MGSESRSPRAARRILLAIIPCAILSMACPRPASSPESTPGAGPEHDLDWTIGAWAGIRRDGADGTEFPMTMTVAPILGGAGQIVTLEVRHDGGVYRGVEIQAWDKDEGRWVRQYVNSVRGHFVRLNGEVDGARSVWQSISPDGARESRLVSEPAGEGRWRRTMSVSEDGGVSWRILWIDNLRRSGGR